MNQEKIGSFIAQRRKDKKLTHVSLSKGCFWDSLADCIR